MGSKYSDVASRAHRVIVEMGRGRARVYEEDPL